MTDMRTAAQVAADQRETLKLAKDLQAKAELTAAEQAELDGHLDKLDALKAEQDEIKAAADAAKARADRLKQAESDIPAGPGRQTTASRPHVVVREGEPEPYNTPRAFLDDVMKVSLSLSGSREASVRLRPFAAPTQATAGSDEQGGYSDAYGGYLVPETVMPGLLSTPAESDPFAGKTTMIPMSTPSVVFNARTDKTHTTSVSGGLTVSRKAETQAAATARMATEQVRLVASTITGAAYATNEILTDSPMSFAAMLAQGFTDEFAAAILNERIRGTGVSQYEGFLEADCKVSVNKETGQAADSIYFDNLIKMRARAWRYSQCIWVANHNVLPQLMKLNQTAGTSGWPVWQLNAKEDFTDTILGRPLFFSEFMASIGDLGDIALINPTEFLEGEYQPMQSATSTHVRFLERESCFLFYKRNAGMWWWRSAITPNKGSETISPIVLLQAR